MMRFLPALLIVLLLLTGCSAPTDPWSVPSDIQSPDSTDTAEQAARLEGYPQGDLTYYPLNNRVAVSVFSLGSDKLLVVCPLEERTEITLLDHQTAAILAAEELPFPIALTLGGVMPREEGFSCYDPLSNTVWVFRFTLELLCRIPCPNNLIGQPLLASHGEALYYCTQDGIRVLELSSGISRVLKHTDCSALTLTGLWMEDTVLSCRIRSETGDQTQLICVQTGTTLYTSREGAPLCGENGNLYIPDSAGGIFGDPNHRLMELFPRQPASELHFLPQSHAAVTAATDQSGTLRLEYYDLSSGLRTAQITLSGGFLLKKILTGSQDTVWFLGEDPQTGCAALYRWDLTRSSTRDPVVYTGLHFTRETPDWDAIDECMRFARQLEERYGIEIRIYEDADDVQPEQYRLEYEYQAPQLLRTLQLLDRCLGQYPPGFLQTLTARFDALTICLVRSIRLSAGEEPALRQDGHQFWDGYHAYIALAVGSSAEGALYHQLCHLIDTIVLNESSEYDTWQSLNPTGFRYDFSYHTNRSRKSTAYLLDGSRSFVDMFSMSFPREDRARIMEYAMLPGNEDLFRSDAMQQKLRKLCLGIREAFGLTQSRDVFLWEQYLEKPLA